ncbi:MAG: hypothetical protein AB8G14_16245, partial [Ilumatobacter sp.]
MSNDTDDPLHENTLLASAYLDGEATADEHALVETSSEALAELTAFTQLRDVVAATAPQASLSEREAHLAGALDVWERMSDPERLGEATPSDGVDAAAAAALSTPVSTSDARRGRSRRGERRSITGSQWFLSAAAVLVVVAGVAAVVRGFLAEDPATDQIAVESAAADAPQLSEVEQNEALEVADGNVGADFVPEAEAIADEVASDPVAAGTAEAVDTDDGLFADDAADEEALEEEAFDESPDLPAEAAQPPPAPEDGGRVELADLEALADYGALAIVGLDADAPVITVDDDFEPPPESCEFELGIERRLLPASFQGQDVNAGIDFDTNTVFAYTDDCAVVASTPLP